MEQSTISGNREISLIISMFRENYEGDPWFGRSIRALLDEVEEDTAFVQPSGQHSILELMWHMITWREFVIDRIEPQKELSFFEENDWRPLDHTDKTLWQQGLQRLEETQGELLEKLSKLEDAFLEDQVKGKVYDFRKLLHGIVQHDIYHIGQIAYITKMQQQAD